MIDIRSISGELLLSVPISPDAVIREELMAADYIQLSWNSDRGDILPAGSYVVYDGERYSLIAPCVPTRANEVEYKYAPQFHSRIAVWNKQPACVYTYEEDGETVKSREFDWSFVGSPADAMQIVKQAIRNETGEDWTVMLSDSLPASIELSSSASSISSVLASIADLCQTEYWAEKKSNILHLSKCEHGDSVALEVGRNVGMPSVTSAGTEYYTRYYALGSTRNITQSASSINGSVNKRLTLDSAAYPYGYKDVKGHFENGVFVSDLENGEVYSKVVVFDDIYPSSDLEVESVRVRMKYRLDGDGKKIKVGGTDESPVYDQYAIWYFKIKEFAFSEDLLIEGLPLSVHFKSGRLAGQEFELIYHDKAKKENTEGDVVPFDVEADSYEIKFKESSGTIIPDLAYIVPQNGDKITLFNIQMPSEYISSAQKRLEEALDKEIAADHGDNDTYEFDSNPVEFFESQLALSLGQKVTYVNGDRILETRVLMNERRLDGEYVQKIRVGNNIIKGSTKELRENVANLNQNVDVLAAFNDLSKSIQDAYGRNQAIVNEAIALINSVWRLEGDNLITDKQVFVKNNLFVEGEAASGDAEGVVTEIAGIRVGDTVYADEDGDGVIDISEAFDGLDFESYLSNYYTKQQVDAKIESLDITGQLTDYYTKQEVDDKIKDIDVTEQLADYATNSSVDGKVNRAMDQVQYWVESKGYATQKYVNTATENVRIEVNALAERVTATEGGIETLEENKADKTSVTALDQKYESTKAWRDRVSPLLDKEGGNINVSTNLIVEGDIISDGSGEIVDSKNKGYYQSYESLVKNYPTASAGDIAFVGVNYPYAIYQWDADNAKWADTGQTGGQNNIPLGDYYTKNETMAVIDAYHVILSQEAYDALEEKEDKLYFTFED